ncbi:hypothetical protein [Bounagaea algeriensis]
MTSRNDNDANKHPRNHPLRMVSISIGAFLVLVSLLVWIPSLAGSLKYLDPDPETGPGVTNEGIIGAIFGVWLLVWTPGIGLMIAGAAGWRKRLMWGFVALAVVMLAVSGATYIVGSTTG